MPRSVQDITPTYVAPRIDARMAVVCALSYSAALFLVDTWVGMGAFAAVLAAVLAAARVRMDAIAKCLAPLAFILAFTVLAHIPQGIGEGLFYALRIMLLACATLAVSFSYDDARLVRAFVSFLSPLRRLRVPVDDAATMLSIAVRFIPLCMDEFNRVASAQRSRGAQLDSGAVFARLKRWGSVLAPMIVGLFRRAEALAQAMEARCYGAPGARTSLHGDERLGAAATLATIASVAAVLAAGVFL